MKHLLLSLIICCTNVIATATTIDEQQKFNDASSHEKIRLACFNKEIANANEDTVRNILEKTDTNGNNILHECIVSGDTEALKRSLNYMGFLGINIRSRLSQKNNNNDTPSDAALKKEQECIATIRSLSQNRQESNQNIEALNNALKNYSEAHFILIWIEFNPEKFKKQWDLL